MKLSKYNITETTSDEKLLIYNTVTAGVLELEGDYITEYNTIVKTGESEKEDLYNALIKGGMLIDDDTDEMAELLVKHNISKYSDSSLTLTIAPTLACNFCCPYCYEQGRKYITMDEEIQNNLVKQLRNKFGHIRELTVSWYGGEPLLVVDVIERLTAKIKEALPVGCVYNADMVSNGYNLTRETAVKLKELGITYVQVTLDGSRSAHDKRRILHNGQPTFEHILKNIHNCCDLLDISIRINVDKTNIDEAREIFDWLEKYELKGKVGYYLAPVDDINGVCNGNICMSKADYAKEEVSFYKEGINRGFYYNAIKPTNYGICGAVSLNSFVIGPDGEIYKCWNDIGYKERSIGNLKDEIKLNGKFIKWLSHEAIKDEECISCKLFPVCFGGCAAFKDKVCTQMKWNLKDIMTLIKKMAEKNSGSCDR